MYKYVVWLFAELSEEGVVVDARVYSYAIAHTQATKIRTLQPDLK